jgi:hypothetical protein
MFNKLGAITTIIAPGGGQLFILSASFADISASFINLQL